METELGTGIAKNHQEDCLKSNTGSQAVARQKQAVK